MTARSRSRRALYILMAAFLLISRPAPPNSPPSTDNPAKNSLPPALPAGPVYLIGGGNAIDCYIEFAQLAGGKDAFIVVLPHASIVPDEVARDYVAFFQKDGAGRVEAILPGDGQSIPADATAVFLAGGAQKRLMERLKVPLPAKNGAAPDPGQSDTLLKQLVAFHRKGGLVGGTSAGAAALADPMIAGWTPDVDANWTPDYEADIQVGLGLVQELIDTHTDERPWRLGRLRRAAGRLRVVGVALPERGGIYIRGGHMRAVGLGQVLIYPLPGNGSARVAPLHLTFGQELALRD